MMAPPEVVDPKVVTTSPPIATISLFAELKAVKVQGTAVPARKMAFVAPEDSPKQVTEEELPPILSMMVRDWGLPEIPFPVETRRAWMDWLPVMEEETPRAVKVKRPLK